MKRVLAIAILGLMLSACGSNKRSIATAEPIARHITVSDEALAQGISDTLQLGRMRQGEVIRQVLRLHNATSKPLVILRNTASCGCTTATYSRKPIAPDSPCDIVIEFDSRGQEGWQMKLMEFYLAETASPLKIYIDAEVQ